MKKIAMSLVLALSIASPAFAKSWKEELFSKLDTDTNGELSYGELTAGGCPTHVKFFKIADKDHSNGLSKAEYFNNRDLLGRCK